MPNLGRYDRQLDICTPDDLELLGGVTIIGAGGIGSTLAFVLSKMGLRHAKVFDFDRVEDHNVSNQLYRPSDVGEYKVAALTNIVSEFTDMQIDARDERFSLQPLSGAIVAAVDSMEQRKVIWQQVLRRVGDISVFVDGRMGGQMLRIYTVNPSRREEVAFYESFWYPDGEAHQAPCTERSIMYTSFVIAGLMGNQLKRVARGERYVREIQFDFTTMSMMTQD